MKWPFVIGLIVIAGLGIGLVPRNHNDREQREGGGVVAGSTASTPHHDLERSPSAVGTSGAHDDAVETDADVIREIETITGATDGMGLIGRHVDLHVDVQNRANDQAFWVGPRDNRLLVVLARDTRDGRQRQTGRPPSHRISPVHGGQRATISGVIRPVPKAEQRYSWNLTREDEQEAADRKIYIAAYSVSSEGHGTH